MRIAILGVRGIGKVHCRILNSLGTHIVAVLSRSKETAIIAEEELKKDFGFDATGYYCLESLLEEELDGVVISTPPELHFEQILACLDREIPVFVEKPMVWSKSVSYQDYMTKLKFISEHFNRKILVNTCNASFVDATKNELKIKHLETFDFCFHTNGQYRGYDIGQDLLPHGISLLTRILGKNFEEDPKEIKKEVSQFRYRISFRYGSTRVTFEFRQGPNITKKLTFAINGEEYHRIQEGRGDSYRVYLKTIKNGRKIPVKDPFVAYNERFLASIKDRRWESYDEDYLNAKLLGAILLKNRKINHGKEKKILYSDSRV